MSRQIPVRLFAAVLTVAMAPAMAGAQAPVRVGGAVQEPKKLVNVDPMYPALARSAKVEGVVIIEATIDEAGNVRDARVLRSNALFDQAAVDAVKQWKYTPTLLNGQPVEVLMTTVVNFALNGNSQPDAARANQPVSTDMDALVDLAKAYRQAGRLDDAAQMLQRALDQVKADKASASMSQAGPMDPVRVGGMVQEPKKVFDVAPAYPQGAKDGKVSGAVILEAVIATDGTVKSIRVLRSNPIFDAAATDAVSQWVYTPTLLNGVPVEVIMTVVVNFVLR